MKSTPQSPLVSILALAAAVAMGAAWSAPIWWVSLTAPNYPQDRFPDGIRIHFGFDGVSNGCTAAATTSRVAQETNQEDLGWRTPGDGDAKHEAEAHETGEHERGEHGPGAREEKREGAREAREALAESHGALDCVHEMNTINHYVGMRPIEVGAPVELLLGKYLLAMFAVMLVGFSLGGRAARVPVMGVGFAAVSAWMVVELFVQGGLARAVATYEEAAGKYFREAERIAAWGAQLSQVSTGIVVGLVALMGFITFASWKWRKFQLLLGLVPALLPLYFVGAYAGWLWFFGHHMHPWGAFTLKPFMPTVFGDGKVAQFSTHSYPHWGFGLLAAVFVFMVVALARRRLELVKDDDARGAA